MWQGRYQADLRDREQQLVKVVVITEQRMVMLMNILVAHVYYHTFRFNGEQLMQLDYNTATRAAH